jgi:hypothetical protein
VECGNGEGSAGPWPNSASIAPAKGTVWVIMFNWWEHFEATPEVVAARAVSVATTGQVVSLEGEPVAVSAETLCVHSETPGADRLGPAVRNALEAAGVTISAP